MAQHHPCLQLADQVVPGAHAVHSPTQRRILGPTNLALLHRRQRESHVRMDRRNVDSPRDHLFLHRRGLLGELLTSETNIEDAAFHEVLRRLAAGLRRGDRASFLSTPANFVGAIAQGALVVITTGRWRLTEQTLIRSHLVTVPLLDRLHSVITAVAIEVAAMAVLPAGLRARGDHRVDVVAPAIDCEPDAVGELGVKCPQGRMLQAHLCAGVPRVKVGRDQPRRLEVRWHVLQYRLAVPRYLTGHGLDHQHVPCEEGPPDGDRPHRGGAAARTRHVPPLDADVSALQEPIVAGVEEDDVGAAAVPLQLAVVENVDVRVAPDHADALRGAGGTVAAVVADAGRHGAAAQSGRAARRGCADRRDRAADRGRRGGNGIGSGRSGGGAWRGGGRGNRSEHIGRRRGGACRGGRSGKGGGRSDRRGSKGRRGGGGGWWA
mmetsp:Transcript_10260/g.30466  ORF Transcript_10260/g.30466 Transcript_10260/m.30466 type:complete len:435 (-) Transcript_10260:717-2021(-)